MQPNTHINYGAIPLAVLFAAGAAFVLFEDVLRHGAEINTSHVMTGLALIGGIAAGHYTIPELKARRVLSGLGCALMFLACTAYIVTVSGARNAETQAAKVATVETNNGERSRLEGQLKVNQERLDQARAEVAAECGSGKGKKCAGKRETVSVYELAVAGVEAKLAILQPAREPNAGWVHAGRIWSAMTGGDANTASQRLELLMPFLLVLITEIGTLVFTHMALRTAQKTVPANDVQPFKALEQVADFEPLPPAKMIVPDLKGSNIIDWSQSFERVHGRKPRLDETTAAFPQVSRSTCYRRLKAA